MSQLWLRDSADGYTQWTSGVSDIEVHAENGPFQVPISVPCRLGNLEETHFALLDTGSARTIIGGEFVELLEDDFGPELLPEMFIQSRLGGWKVSGPLHELKISLPSLGNLGVDLDVNAQVVAIKDFPSLMVLGVYGFLESIRFAIEPSNEPMMYFGLYD
ncbi:MAG: hypothetical protein OER22_01070 [Gammaproteobacteria bacterium]|nr:hypothetical protein [Gammaproteobacteria bacterium]MDH3372505.1 hypothetical protein [Gammaproteobacteria bacterium]MDH3551183.1 hypothetical protein [Gammaproteobacteria bacterium]